MAIIHQATLQPTKLELLGDWLPQQPWCRGSRARKLGSYRFDDPAGEVGLEAFLLDTGAETVQVPLSYRASRLDGAEEQLIGTIEHSVLGTRYVYDAIGDPVWRTALATAILAGGTEASEDVTDSSGAVITVRESTAHVRGSGDGSIASADWTASHPHAADGLVSFEADGQQLIMVRTVGVAIDVDATLTGRWESTEDAVLGGVRLGH